MAWPRARPAWPSAARLLLLLALACAEAGPAGPAGPASDMVVFIKEQCYQPALDMHALRQLVEGRARGAEDARLNVKFMSSKELCGAQPGELAALLAALSTDSTRAVVGSFEAAVCGVLDLLATMHPTKMIVTWGCPQQELVAGAVDYGHVPDGGPGGARVRRLLPPLAATVQGAVRVATYYRMRTAAIVSSGSGWWQLAAQTLDLALQAADVEVRHRVVLPGDQDAEAPLLDALRPLLSDPVRVVVLCVPLRTALWTRVVAAADSLSLIALPTTALLALHPTSAIPFMAHDPAAAQPPPPPPSPPPSPSAPSSTSTARRRNATAPPRMSSTSSSTLPSSPASASTSSRITTPASASVPAYVTSYRMSTGRDAARSLLPMFLPQASWRADTQSGLLILTALDPDLRLEAAFLSTEGCPDRGCPQLQEHLELWHYIQRCWDLLARPAQPAQPTQRASNSSSSTGHGAAWEATLVLLDWVQGRDSPDSPEGSRWRPLIELHVGGGLNVSEARVRPLTPRAWPRWKNVVSAGTALHSLEGACDADDENGCDEPASIFSSRVQLAVMVAVFACIALVVVVLATIARQQLLRKRMSKGPCKILLTPNDLVFPHMPDARRVDEGMEAMLCCWLQQLQEFGGPEVDKPDLLKGSVGSLKSLHPPPGQGKSPGSSGSLARNIIVDPKARYNGDLVQLKELPVSGTFELKTKAMDILLTLHGLRHENVNPLLGCLLDSARPALVMEWCSRGSLEDVLVQDEIKLDWSFRLSLLTDLVRGMKYLHSTPVRVHGRLTSRNCVIDARWVLKVTDYGLPSFYEAQGITPPAQTARELLWTAPELLRDEGLRRRGTQPGDVYSFSIVMQEVVLRGEPFCILQLKPEEIIEKLKRPPPLIRPSVSKGAAPPEAINIMRQCWAELPESRPDFNTVHDQFKTLNHGRKVNFVDTMFQLLEKYSNNLEELIRERTEQLDCEKKKTEQLLNRMLPSQVAERLKMGQPVEPEDYQEVTIYFSDIVGFTAISCHSTPGQVVDLLNDLYTCFDATINAYNVYKVETIGDAYMVVGGLPVRVGDHADQVATMALDLLHQSGRFQIRHLPHTPLRLRIGLHTGPCCAGVVGLTMPRYCLFGDTVNTASRMESTGSAWRIHISEATKKKLDDAYSLEYRGMTELKGKGLMPTYWLLGKKGFDKELPIPPPIGESHGLEESLLLPPKVTVPALSPTSSTGPPLTCSSEPTSAVTKRKSFESCSSGEAQQSVSIDVASKVHSAISAADAESAEKRASRMLVCASIDNERTPTRRGSLQLATESAKISLYTMSISESKPGSRDSRDLQEHDVDAELAVQALPLSATTPQPLTSRSETAPSGVPFITSPGMSTPFSASEVAVDLLGVSFLNPPSTWRSSSTNLSGPPRPKKPTAFLEEEDLSSGFNHYRCLSPHDPPQSRVAALASLGRGFLKRQYSLDRGDDPAGSSGSGGPGGVGGPATVGCSVGRGLHKQNSAGAAHDLQRIEEIPVGLARPAPAVLVRPRDLSNVSSKSVSAESLA